MQNLKAPQKKIIIKYGELWLKSEPVRRRFLKALAENIKAQLKGKTTSIKLKTTRDMLILKSEKDVKDVLKKVFGISWFAEAYEVGKNKEEIANAVLEIAKTISPYQTFAIRAKRSDKKIPFTSKEIENEMGAIVKRKVDLSNPDVNIYIEMRKEGVYVFSEKIRGASGLPYGVSGCVLSLISGGIDSPVASWMMMKRGCEVVFLHFDPEFFSKGNEKEKIKLIVEKLRAYSPRKLSLYIVPFGEIQKEIVGKCERRLTCVLCRRMMYRTAEELARKIGAKALVTGENLAQVASQTLDNLFVENEVLRIPIFRPLIGFDKEETIAIAKNIGTYETSIGIGCCALSPEKPITKAEIEKIKKEEKHIKNIKNLVKKAIEKSERIVI